jgi:hypothetical protein
VSGYCWVRLTRPTLWSTNFVHLFSLCNPKNILSALKQMDHAPLDARKGEITSLTSKNYKDKRGKKKILWMIISATPPFVSLSISDLWDVFCNSRSSNHNSCMPFFYLTLICYLLRQPRPPNRKATSYPWLGIIVPPSVVEHDNVWMGFGFRSGRGRSVSDKVEPAYQLELCWLMERVCVYVGTVVVILSAMSFSG